MLLHLRAFAYVHLFPSMFVILTLSRCSAAAVSRKKKYIMRRDHVKT